MKGLRRTGIRNIFSKEPDIDILTLIGLGDKIKYRNLY